MKNQKIMIKYHRDRFQREHLERRFQSYFDSGNGVLRNAIVR